MPHSGCSFQKSPSDALLFPQKLAPYTSGDGWLRIHAGDRTITYNAPNEIGGSKSFEAGKTTTLDLRLTDGNVEPDPGLEPDEEFRNKNNYFEALDSWLGGTNNMTTNVWWADHTNKRK